MALPIIGGIVQKRVEEQKRERRLKQEGGNSAEREAFLRDLYDLPTASKAK